MCYKQQTISICSDDTDHNADPGIFSEIEASSRMSHATPSMMITIFSCVGSIVYALTGVLQVFR